MPLPGISQPGCERSLTRELRVSPRKAWGRLPALAAIYPFIIPSQGWPIVPLSDRSENLWGKPPLFRHAPAILPPSLQE